MEHADTLGNRFWMHSGAVQVMNAGSGVQHGGGMKAAPGHDEFHEIQLWVNVPADRKMTPPTVQTHDADAIPTVILANSRARVIAGDVFGQTGPVQTTQPTQIVHAVLGAASMLEIPTPDGFAALVYVLRGTVQTNGQATQEYETLSVPAGSSLTLETSDGAEVLALAGHPIGEPVALGGPFVMTTQAEIRQAFTDLKAGLFGTIPPKGNS